jgi:hypothetical protein
MRIRKTLIKRSDDGAVLTCDTIEIQGKLWLVPRWLVGWAQGTERAERIICLRGLPLVKPGPEDRVDFELTIPLSRDTLEGRPGTSQGLIVILEPEITRSINT